MEVPLYSHSPCNSLGEGNEFACLHISYIFVSCLPELHISGVFDEKLWIFFTCSQNHRSLPLIRSSHLTWL